MKSFRSIICGFDFTPNSENAIREALRIATVTQGTVTACHVVSPRYIDDQQQFLNLPTDVLLRKVRDAVEFRVAEVSENYQLKPSVKVLMGRPEFALTEEARSMQAELLVLGAATGNSTTGVIARRCLQETSCPVLINRGHHGGQYRSIVTAVDLTDLSQSVIEAASALATDRNTPFKVVHSHYPPWTHATNVLYNLEPAQNDDFIQQYDELLNEKMAQVIRSSSPDLKIEPEIVENMSEVDAILRTVKEMEADLLAFGCHGPSGLKERVIGTSAERLLHRSHCSVLAVPAPDA